MSVAKDGGFVFNFSNGNDFNRLQVLSANVSRRTSIAYMVMLSVWPGYFAAFHLSRAGLPPSVHSNAETVNYEVVVY